MTAIPTQRHPGDTDSAFLPQWACPYCGAVTAACDEPGCLRQEIEDNYWLDRNEDV